jgi:hypothetical protein
MSHPQLLKMPPAYYAQRIQVNAAQAEAMMMDELHLIVQKLQVVYIYSGALTQHLANTIKY